MSSVGCLMQRLTFRVYMYIHHNNFVQIIGQLTIGKEENHIITQE